MTHSSDAEVGDFEFRDDTPPPQPKKVKYNDTASVCSKTSVKGAKERNQQPSGEILPTGGVSALGPVGPKCRSVQQPIQHWVEDPTLDRFGLPHKPVCRTPDEIFHVFSLCEYPEAVSDTYPPPPPLFMHLCPDNIEKYKAQVQSCSPFRVSPFSHNRWFEYLFTKWIRVLLRGRTVLLQGFGSKHPLLSCFSKLNYFNKLNVLRVEVMGSHFHCSFSRIVEAISACLSDFAPRSSNNHMVAGEYVGHKRFDDLLEYLRNKDDMDEFADPGIPTLLSCYHEAAAVEEDLYEDREATPHMTVKSTSTKRDHGGGVTTEGEYIPDDPRSIVLLLISSLDHGKLSALSTFAYLSELATLRRVWVVLTYDTDDRVILPSTTTSRFNFSVYHTHTYIPFKRELNCAVGAEVVDENSHMPSISGIEAVLRSVTHNAIRVFKVAVDMQLQEQGPVNAQELLVQCQKKALVSNYHGLQSHLSYFLEQKILSTGKEGIYPTYVIKDLSSVVAAMARVA